MIVSHPIDGAIYVARHRQRPPAPTGRPCGFPRYFPRSKTISPSVSIRILQPPNDAPPDSLRPTNAVGYLGAYLPHAPAMTVANPLPQHALARISPCKDFAGRKRAAVGQKRAPHLPL